MQKIIITLLLQILLLTGCETPRTYYQAKKDPFIMTNYQAVDALIASTGKQRNLSSNAPVLVANLVNTDALGESSSLGKIIAEQVQGRLAQHGYAVSEMKLRSQLFVKNAQGDLLPSPEVVQLSMLNHAQAIVLGTYAVANNFVYVSLKMVGSDNVILGAHDYTLPRSDDMRALLKKPCC